MAFRRISRDGFISGNLGSSAKRFLSEKLIDKFGVAVATARVNAQMQASGLREIPVGQRLPYLLKRVVDSDRMALLQTAAASMQEIASLSTFSITHYQNTLDYILTAAGPSPKAPIAFVVQGLRADNDLLKELFPFGDAFNYHLPLRTSEISYLQNIFDAGKLGEDNYKRQFVIRLDGAPDGVELFPVFYALLAACTTTNQLISMVPAAKMLLAPGAKQEFSRRCFVDLSNIAYKLKLTDENVQECLKQLGMMIMELSLVPSTVDFIETEGLVFSSKRE
jgi:hypothetical protein